MSTTETPSRLLGRTAANDGDRPAVVGADGTGSSCRELWARSEAVSQALLASGVRPGDRIASWSPPVLEAVLLAVAGLRVGAVLVELDPELELERVTETLAAAQAGWIFIRASFQGRQYPAEIKSLRGRLPELREVVTHGRQPRFERALPGGWAAFVETGAGMPVGALAEREHALDVQPAPLASIPDLLAPLLRGDAIALAAP